MLKIIVGFILGFFVATMGLTGVAQAVDHFVEKVKTTSINIESK